MLALVPNIKDANTNVQGSEWSAEDWTGLASQVESQVQSNGGN